MTGLLEMKQAIKVFYTRYELFVTYAARFLLALISFFTISARLDFGSVLMRGPILIGTALIGAVLPVSFITAASALFVLAQMFEASLIACVVTAAMFLLMYLFYYRFSAGDALVIVLTPVLFVFHIPYMMPILLPLLFSPLSLIPMLFGTVIYFYLHFIVNNLALFTGAGGPEEIMANAQTLMTGAFGNRQMMVYLISFAITYLLVWVIRRSSMDNAWLIAVISGFFTCLIVLFIGDVMMDTQVAFPAAILGALLAACFAMVIRFFVFHLDYSRIEKVQFEDDEYYYYVKAVPKYVLTEKQQKVRNINRVQEAPPPAKPEEKKLKRAEEDDRDERVRSIHEKKITPESSGTLTRERHKASSSSRTVKDTKDSRDKKKK